ncbi:hypothetical protein B5U98_26895 [Bosea sp. Tri-39]|nr:hypothetical protein BLM15_29095 [Bosea sp. Tri-49]RXT16792.1 hypothetical protein B5U98_26895 [Bosea sp. Tri-39]RXT37697.1 hypothetical protein B5U99_12175 [Bosea sp. Tri-54]
MPAATDEVKLIDPVLPTFLYDITLRGLKLTGSQFDLRVHRNKSDVTINVLKRWAHSDASVVMTKTR